MPTSHTAGRIAPQGVWFPALKVDTGASVFMTNLCAGLQQAGVPSEMTWFPGWMELCPSLMSRTTTPAGTGIIHVNCDYGFAFAGRGLPLVLTVFHWIHGADFVPHRGAAQALYHRLLLRRYQDRSLRNATALTTTSDYSARQLRAALPGLEPRLIYPGIDTDFFHPGPARPRGDVFNLLFVGSPSRRKGFDLLPRIAAALGPGFRISYPAGPVFSGTPGLRRIGRLSRAQLLEQYRHCDALIFPTRYEGFGLAAAEAMACGKPVIASHCTSLPELVEDGETGILCAPDDVHAFVAAARYLASKPQTCLRMGQAGRERVLRHFTLQRMTGDYLRLYRALAEPGNAGVN